MRHASERRVAGFNASASGGEPKPNTPAIKTVDDEGLLRMMDDGPAALAEWPDGRQSLLILVTHSATARREPETGLNQAASLPKTDDMGPGLNRSND